MAIAVLAPNYGLWVDGQLEFDPTIFICVNFAKRKS
jgi:hypothetical protein